MKHEIIAYYSAWFAKVYVIILMRSYVLKLTVQSYLLRFVSVHAASYVGFFVEHSGLSLGQVAIHLFHMWIHLYHQFQIHGCSIFSKSLLHVSMCTVLFHCLVREVFHNHLQVKHKVTV